MREEAIQRMEDAFRYVEPVDLPEWAIRALVLPFFFVTVLHLMLNMCWSMLQVMGGCILKFLCAPLVAGYLLADLVGISWWNFKRITERMSR
jgi:hypothetical protein